MRYHQKLPFSQYRRQKLFEIKNAFSTRFSTQFLYRSFEDPKIISKRFSISGLRSSIFFFVKYQTSRNLNRCKKHSMIIRCIEKMSPHSTSFHSILFYKTVLKNEVCQILQNELNLKSSIFGYIDALNNNVRIQSLPHRRATIPKIL